MTRRREFDSLSAILTAVAPRLGLAATLCEHRLRERWPDIVGEQIAAHTRPDQIRFKKLYVLVEHSVWLQQLTFLKPDLLGKVRQAVGPDAVTELVLRIGEIGPPPERRPLGEDEDLSNPAPSPEIVELAAAHAAHVTDPSLRAQLTAVMAATLALPPRRTGSRRAAP
jgi:hypothetical protein